MSNVLQVQQVSKCFGSHQALQQLSFELAQGELLALLGHNGAGKTTLIKMLLGLIRPDQGSVLVDGVDPANKRTRNQLSVGYLPEQVSLYDNLTGREVLQYFAKLRGIESDRVSALLAEQGLEQAADKRVSEYSKGMKQRLGLAQALLNKPKLLLLDEPTVGLDPSASMAFYQKIKELCQQGTTVVICTHELTLIEPHLDRALILAGGQKRGFGSLAQLQQQAKLNAYVQLPRSAPSLTEADRFFDQYDQDCHQIAFAPEQQSELLQLLCQRPEFGEFSVQTVGLQQIYHHCQQQEPVS